MTNNISIIKGSKPILIVSIHACSDWHELSTKEINEELQRKENYFSLIYTGLKKKCVENTEEATYDLIDMMLTKYDRIGVISLHRRRHSCRGHKVDNNYFELGTLSNQSMDNYIKTNLRARLSKKSIVFDDNILFTGGTECINIHIRYNDPTFVVSKTSSFKPNNNLVQLAQIEINGTSNKEDYPFHYNSVLTLAKCMEEYLYQKK